MRIVHNYNLRYRVEKEMCTSCQDPFMNWLW